jgi:hypothetical protein
VIKNFAKHKVILSVRTLICSVIILFVSVVEILVINDINDDLSYLDYGGDMENLCSVNQNSIAEVQKNTLNELDRTNIILPLKIILVKQLTLNDKIFLYQDKVNCIESRITNLDSNFIDNIFNAKYLSKEAKKINSLTDELSIDENEIVRDVKNLEELIKKFEEQYQKLNLSVDEVQTFQMIKGYSNLIMISIKLANMGKTNLISKVDLNLYAFQFRYNFTKNNVSIANFVFIKYLCILGLVLNVFIFIIFVILVNKRFKNLAWLTGKI